MKLIVGLGNPGTKYKNTRHNIGFMFVDELANSYKLKFSLDKALKAEIATFNYNDEKVILMKPITFMNLSGEAVNLVIKYYKIDINDILVIYDDLDLPTGKVRIRLNGSSGGQKGMKNIIEMLKTEEIKRIRIGIDNNKLIDTADYVLGKPSLDEKIALDIAVSKAKKMFELLITRGFEELMQVYN
jgi:PTH1 family peptidyl-tRNA hydrolase